MPAQQLHGDLSVLFLVGADAARATRATVGVAAVRAEAPTATEAPYEMLRKGSHHAAGYVAQSRFTSAKMPAGRLSADWREAPNLTAL